MDMSVTSVCVTPSLVVKLIVLISFFWPFVAMSLLSRRGRSAGPAAAVLVPLALAASGVWFGLARVMRGMAISGGGVQATAAGITEALSMLDQGGFFAVMLIVFAATRRHRPIVDRTTAALFTVLLVDVIGALFAAVMVANRPATFPLLIAGAIVGALIAMAAMIWTFLTGRGRVSSGPLPYGVPVVAITIVVMGVIVWQLSHGYAAFAMGMR
jgi:hypothetical protein